MAEKETVKPAKPPIVDLSGEEGWKAFMEILRDEADDYDPKKEARKARRLLKKEGIIE